MTDHDEAVRSLKVIIEAVKDDHHVALEDVLRYVETLKPRPDCKEPMTLDDAWSRLNLIIAEPQIPLTGCDAKALTTLRNHMLADKQRLEESTKTSRKLMQEADEIKRRLETKAQDLLKEIYRL